jgi:hypothetical protein
MTRSRVIAALLALVLTVTAIGAATAQGGMAAERALCGAEARPVLAQDGLPLFDSDGAPVEARDLPCLDCTLGACALPPPPDGAAAPGHVASVTPTDRGLSAGALRRMGGKGRGPPRAA